MRRTRKWYGFPEKTVPMSNAEISHAYARREAEQARAQAELRLEHERALASTG